MLQTESTAEKTTFRTCANCEKTVPKANRFCPECGSENKKVPETLTKLLFEYSQEHLNWDKGVPRTIREIFTTPEKVVDGFINGARKKYTSPSKFLLLSWALVNLVLWSVIEASLDDSSLTSSQIPDGAHKDFGNAFSQYYMPFLVLTLPFIAYASKASFKTKSYTLPEHLILNTYLYGASNFASFVWTCIRLAFIPAGYSYIMVVDLLIGLVLSTFFYYRVFRSTRIFDYIKMAILYSFILTGLTLVFGICFGVYLMVNNQTGAV
ncbi:hypothetical protein FUAX_26740 [Fulvitalea axinellae]|uniref:DUF3667 domain-containing protein n=1 Tax=Fulvitalea axinellae TaxID=1182444 RepID=A0AAU9CQK1_9BACT|nr:hypothetical protein FUAX_26740 [Fulvitalea axinellae]